MSHPSANSEVTNIQSGTPYLGSPKTGDSATHHSFEGARQNTAESIYIQRARIRIISALAICIPIGLIALPWDFPLTLAIRYGGIRGDWQKLVNLSEVFAHFLSLTMLFSLLLWCDEKRRRIVGTGICFVALAGLVANLSKLLIPRARPNSLDHLTPEDYPNSAWDLWGPPLTGPWFSEEIRSFPSGHAATAAAVAIALTMAYPRGKWFFASLALMASFQRLQVGAHYISDVMGGICITLILAYLCVPFFSRRSTEANNASSSRDASVQNDIEKEYGSAD